MSTYSDSRPSTPPSLHVTSMPCRHTRSAALARGGTLPEGFTLPSNVTADARHVGGVGGVAGKGAASPAAAASAAPATAGIGAGRRLCGHAVANAGVSGPAGWRPLALLVDGRLLPACGSSLKDLSARRLAVGHAPPGNGGRCRAAHRYRRRSILGGGGVRAPGEHRRSWGKGWGGPPRASRGPACRRPGGCPPCYSLFLIETRLDRWRSWQPRLPTGRQRPTRVRHGAGWVGGPRGGSPGGTGEEKRMTGTPDSTSRTTAASSVRD